MNKAAQFLLASLVGLVFSSSAWAESIKLQVKGAYWPNCTKVLTTALGEVPGVKVQGSLKPVKTEAQVVTIDLDTAKSDVGDVAKAIAHSKTPHIKLVEPEAALVVPAKGVTKADTDKVRTALQNVKGVVTKESSAQAGEIIVQLSHEGGAKLLEIKKALSDITK